MAVLLQVAALMLGWGAGAAEEREDAGPSIAWKVDERQRASIEVHGLSTAELKSLAALNSWEEVFAVRVDQPEVANALITPTMLGRYAVEGGILTFRPLFPLQAGLDYRAVFRNPAREESGGAPVASKHRVAKLKVQPSTVVSAVYPSTDRIPENLLKFYLHFSAPMSRGQIYDHVRLFHVASGKEVDIPFLELGEELWDRTLTRVTLFMALRQMCLSNR